MRPLLFIILLAAAAFSIGCGEPKPATPLETFQTYVKAIKAKDTTTMKILLSDATLKMHAKEAKSQGTTVDEIVKRQTLYAEGQKTVEHRKVKIEGDKATLEVKNSYGGWQTVPFVFEDGAWKIDTAGGATQILNDIEAEQNKAFDNLGNFNSVEPISPVQGQEP